MSLPESILNHRPSILVVDDTADNLRLLKRLLESESCEVRVAPNGTLALQSISSSLPDLILLDVKMPDIDGFELCRRFKASPATRDIPVIFLTALDSVHDEERGLDLGALDYIPKPFNPALVKARIRNHVRCVRQRKVLEMIVGMDTLTEIPNRKRFDEDLAREWRRALRTGLSLSLAVLDLDGFTAYNATLGFPAGDRALQAVAAQLNGCVRRPGDLVARCGGDSFGVLLPETMRSGAEQIVQQILERTRKLELCCPRGEDMRPLTFCAGGVTVTAHRDDEPQRALEQASENLRRAREQGAERVVWSSSTHPPAP